MVSRSTRDRLLDAAAAEFAAKGFDGAKVDRIAERARVNKAMLYYHFTSKAGLYRAILGTLFDGAAEATEAVHAAGGTPEDQIRRFVRAIAAEALDRPHFPALWLREVADGGRHLGPEIVTTLGRVLGTLARILEEGRRAGVFGNANPLIVQMGIVSPLLFLTASAPVRQRLAHALPPTAVVTREMAIEYVQTATVAALTATASMPARRAPARSRSRSASRPRRSRRSSS